PERLGTLIPTGGCGVPGARGSIRVRGARAPPRNPSTYEEDAHMSSATVRGGYAASSTAEGTGTGWIMFASILLFIAGIWNFIDGILAIGSSHVYLAGAHYVFGDL